MNKNKQQDLPPPYDETDNVAASAQARDRNGSIRHQSPVSQPGTVVVSLPRHENSPLIRQRHAVEERRFPLAALYFLFGWLFPPFWVVGACCCAGSSNRYESWWGKANFVMVMVTITASIMYGLFAMMLGNGVLRIR